VPADKVTVVTNPKEAANSLANMVKIMESRYQRFQLYGVRNIEGYNKEADKRGEPREYFIVVVIDELADLMLVAEARSRTTSSAWHRWREPSHPHGTGHPAPLRRRHHRGHQGNLPCRVAMQVISQVDSRVILDVVGAESLQGRGTCFTRARARRCRSAARAPMSPKMRSTGSWPTCAARGGLIIRSSRPCPSRERRTSPPSA